MRITDVSGGETPAGGGLRERAEQAVAAPEKGGTSPAVPRRVLGTRLRLLREAQYITQAEAGEAIRVPSARIDALERGRTGFPQRDVHDLLTIYGVTDEDERAVLLALTDQANTPGWWQSFAGAVPPWLQTYIGLEQAASVIRSYEVQFVPGLLQTREYARAVIELACTDESDACLQRRVALRMRRQQILYGPRAPHLWAVIDEAALRRPVGGTATMRAQVRHLIAVSDLPHVTVQVMPFSAGGHAAAGGPVTLLRMPVSELPDVVYLERLTGASYLEDDEEIETYRHVIDCLVTRSEPPAATRELLQQIAADMERTGVE